jgi:hypothetical protein
LGKYDLDLKKLANLSKERRRGLQSCSDTMKILRKYNITGTTR